MAQRLNKKLVVGLTMAGMAVIAAAGILLVYALPGRDPEPVAEQARKLVDAAKKLDAQVKAKNAESGNPKSEADAAKLLEETNKLQNQRDEDYSMASKYFAKAASRALTAGDSKKANEYLVKAGEMALTAGELNVATGCWNRVLLNDPQNEGAQQKIVELMLEQAELYGNSWWQQVQKEAERLCDISQNANLAGLHALGRALVAPDSASKEDLEKGKKLLEEAFKRDEANPKFAASLAGFYLRSHERALADAQSKQEPTEAINAQKDEVVAQALAVYDRLFAALAKAPKDDAALSTAWRQRAQLHLTLRDGAQRDYRAKLNQRATPAELTNLRKAIKTHSDEALKCLEAALKASPNDDETLVLMGAYWRSTDSVAVDPAEQKIEKQGYTAKAKEYFQKAILANKDSFDGYLQLQDIYFRQGEDAFSRQDKAAMQDDFHKAEQVLQERIKRGVARTGIYSWRNKLYMGSLQWQLFQINTVTLEHLRKLANGQDDEETKPLLERMKQVRQDYVAESPNGEKDPRAMFMKARIEMLGDAQPYQAISTLRQLQDVLDRGDLWVRTKVHLAELCLRINEPGPAVEALQSVAKVYPNAEGVLGMLGRVIAAMPGREAEAEAYAKRALAINPDNSDALMALAQLYQQQKNWRQLEEVQKKLASNTPSIDARLRQANLLLARSADPETNDSQLLATAQDLLRQVLKDDPSNIQALRSLVASLGSDEDNRTEIITALAKAKADVKQKMAKASASTQPADVKPLQDLEKNIQYLEVVADPKISEDNRREKLAAMAKQGKDPFLTAVTLYRLYLNAPGHEPEAVANLKEAYRLKPDDPGVVEMLFRVAISSFKNDKGEEIIKPDWTLAQQLVKRAVDLGIDRSGGHYYQGQMLLANTELKDHLAQAEKEFREGLKLFPYNSNAYAWLGRTLVYEKRFDEAQQAFEEALKQNPRNALAATHLAQLAEQRGDSETKAHYLQVCKDLGVTDPWVKSQLAILQDLNHPEEGIARREKLRKDLAAQNKPQDVQNLVQLANLYQRAGKLDQVKPILAECFALRPKDLNFVEQYARFLMSVKPPDIQTCDAVLHKTLESFGPAEAEQKAATQLLIAAQAELRNAHNLPSEEKAPKPQEVEAAYLAAAAISDKPRILTEVAAYYRRNHNPAKSEEWLRKAIANAERDGNTNEERQARGGLLEVMFEVRDLKQAPEILKEVQAYQAKFDDPTGLLAMSEWASMVGRETLAIKYASDYIEAATGLNKALGFWRRGTMNYRRGDWDLAINDLREAKILTASGFNYEHRILLARCLQITGQTDQAVAELTSLLKEKPGWMRVAQELFKIYMDRGVKKYDEAEAFIMPLYRANPQSPVWVSMLADVAIARKDDGRAIQYLREAAKNTNYAPQTLDKLLSVFMEYKRYDDMEEYINTSLSAEIRTSPVVLLRTAAMYAAKGDTAKATDLFGQATAGGTNVAGILAEIAVDLTNTMGKDAVFDFVKRGAESRPDDPVAQLLLARMLKERSDYESFMKIAQAMDKKLSTSDPKYLPLRLYWLQGIAEVQYKTKQWEQTRSTYEEMLKVAPQGSVARPAAMNNLAYLLIDQLKDPASAMSYAEEANKLLPGQSNILDTLGWALILQGKYDRGIATVREGIYAAQTLDLAQMAAVHYHAAYGLVKRSEVSAKAGKSTEADQDVTEAKLDCRRAQELLFSSGKDDDQLLPKVIELAKQIGLDLPAQMPAAAAPQS